MPVTTSNALDALLFVRNGDTTARWNFPAAVGSSFDNPAGLGTGVSLTYSFISSAPAYYDQPGVRIFNAVEQAATRQVLASIASMVNVVFQETQGVGQFTYAMSSQDPSAGAFAFVPAYSYVLTEGNIIQSVTESEFSGDVWFNGNVPWTNADWQAGGNGYATLLHETGHALGLKHPFEAPANGYVLNAALDTERHTVMSYTLPTNTDIVQVTGTQFSYSYTWAPLRPTTLMLLDIEALQSLYGANTSTRAGNDSYTWATNAEILETLWDGGGIDVIDCSNQILSCLIDLRAGNFSSIALRRTDAQKRAALDLPAWFTEVLPTGTYDGRNNLAIAKGVIIENAIGGRAADVLTGNAQANVLSGGAGNDVLNGLGGNDILNGGPGSDTLRGGLGDDLYVIAQEGDVVVELTGQGTDQVNSSLADFDLPDFVENGRILSTGSADLGGNDLNNTLFAGAGNNDLKGRGGIDTVSYAYGLSGKMGVLVDLQTGLEQNTGGSGLDKLSSIENLIGSARADTLIGNAVANTLRGGLGQDTLSGLGGADHFVFDTALTFGNRDRVLDFVSGVDKLVLDDDIFTVLSGSVAGTALPAGFFRVGSAPLDADDYFLYTPNTDVLWYAPSANATINLLPVAVIPMGNLTPLASDFLVIA